MAEDNKFPNSWHTKVIGRRRLIGGAGSAALGIAGLALTDKIDDVARALGPILVQPSPTKTPEAPQTQVLELTPSPTETPIDPHFISPHLGIEIDNKNLWKHTEFITPDGSYLDTFKPVAVKKTEEEDTITAQIEIFAQETSMDLDNYANQIASSLIVERPASPSQIVPPRPQLGEPIYGEESRRMTALDKNKEFKHDVLIFKIGNFMYVFDYLASPTNPVNTEIDPTKPPIMKNEFDASCLNSGKLAITSNNDIPQLSAYFVTSVL